METKKDEIKQEVINPDMAATLENLIGEIKQEKEPKKKGRKPKTAEEPQQPEANENDLLIDCVLEMSDHYLISIGLSPINMLQKMLLRVGLVGTVKKYGLSIGEYPEVVLISGLAWIGVDKYAEIEAKRRKVAEDKGEGKK